MTWEAGLQPGPPPSTNPGLEGLEQTMSNDPPRVPMSKVLAFLRDIGLDPVDPDNLKSVTFGADGVSVVRYRRDEQGLMYLSGPNEVATETVTMAMDADS